MNAVIRCFLGSAVAVAFLLPPVRGEGLTKQEVAKLGKAATVFVEVKGGSGSGFCVHPSGLFITNHHVIAGGGDIQVVLNTNLKEQKILKAKVVRSDKDADLALLQVDGVKDLPTLPFGTDDKLAELTEVVACGFPFGQGLSLDKKEYPAISVNHGSITSLRMKDGELQFIQLDVTLNPGNSGGPVLNMEGKVVGVVAAGIRGANINFAIPVRKVRRFVEKPNIQFSPPVLDKAGLKNPVNFEVRVVPILPSDKSYEVDLVLRTSGEDKERRFHLTRDGDTYRVEVPRLVPPAPLALRLTATFGDSSVSGSVPDATFKIGARELKLSEVRRLDLKEKARAVLADSSIVEGALSGLDKVAVGIGEQSVTLNLSKATSMQVLPALEPTSVMCTVIVSQRGDKPEEVARVNTDLTLPGTSLVPTVDPSKIVVPPPTLDEERVVKKLPDIASDVSVGGGGRYLVFQFPKLKKLGIFDVSEARVVRYIPLAEDKACFAAGLEKLVVGLPEKGVLERWNLATGEKELTVAAVLPTNVNLPTTISSVIMGSASKGPVVVNGSFFDLQSLKILAIKPVRGTVVGPWPVSADGTVFGTWSLNNAPGTHNTYVLQGDELLRYEEGPAGHVCPGPDGSFVYTAGGPRTNQLKGVNWKGGAGSYCLPAVQGNYYLAVRQAEGKYTGGLTVFLAGYDAALAKFDNFDHQIRFADWDRDLFGPWKRIFFIPQAKVIAILPPSNDQVILQRFDVDQALDKSGVDYLLVTSQPPATAKRGSEFTYPLVVKSKKGGVKYSLDAGPEGMTISPAGVVKWPVAAKGMESEGDVIISIRDSAGQEIFHTFKVKIVKE